MKFKIVSLSNQHNPTIFMAKLTGKMTTDNTEDLKDLYSVRWLDDHRYLFQVYFGRDEAGYYLEDSGVSRDGFGGMLYGLVGADGYCLSRLARSLGFNGCGVIDTFRDVNSGWNMSHDVNSRMVRLYLSRDLIDRCNSLLVAGELKESNNK